MNLKEINLTPDRFPRKLFETPFFFLLETSLPDETNRWTIASWAPSKVLSSDRSGDFLSELRDGLKENERLDADLPFTGGWIGYLGYEFYRFLEKKVPVRRAELIPEAMFGFYENFYLYDHRERKGYITLALQETADFGFVPAGPATRQPLELRYERSQGAARLSPTRTTEKIDSLLPGGREIPSNFTRAEYLSTIERTKNYITAGDCYQVNLSQRFSAPVSESPYEIYQKLKIVSPAPYFAFLNLGSAQILSSSPECFLKVDRGKVTTKPIKGTRPRGETNEEDAGLREELLTSAKDHAELLMITDLLRNDLGRVCEKGSVKVPRLAEAESYAQVHHLVSTIEGRLRGDADLIDLISATFPGGSITGAPKIRAMEIIHELEPTPREVYTGAIGFMSLNGEAEFNVAIRTIVLKEGRGYFWGGGGIVADSDPEQEYLETLVKVHGIEKALARYS